MGRNINKLVIGTLLVGALATGAGCGTSRNNRVYNSQKNYEPKQTQVQEDSNANGVGSCIGGAASSIIPFVYFLGKLL